VAVPCLGILPKASGWSSVTIDIMVVAKSGAADARKEELMATSTEEVTRDEGVVRVIESVQDAEQSALEAVRKFVDTVNGVFPDVSSEGGPRQKIIDSAFKMTEQLVGASNQLAQRIVKVTENALREAEENEQTSKK
jgi:hypothetical protein